ncbi:hypothetical protein KAX21_00215, partial [candidate division WOR-3 bacterium]|nr:hypothetical protein [candidate division WOR-3 bacterium]
MSILLFGGIQIGLAQATGQKNLLMLEYDPAAPAVPLSAVSQEPTHYVGKLDLPMIPQGEDTFATYAYTYGDMVIFSYGDSNQCWVIDSKGKTVWSGIVMRDKYIAVQGLSDGVYLVMGNKEFSLISGDPWGMGLGAWTAVDENSSPGSTKFLSMGPGASVWLPLDFEQALTVFTYHNGTHVVIKNIDVDTLIWEGDLDSAEYYYYRHSNDAKDNFPYSVESTKPVSTMTGGGLGFYAPASNGTFTGRDFMTYIVFVREPADMRVVPQDLQIVPWEDETWVTITDLDNPADTIWRQFFKNRGEIKGIQVPLPDYKGRALYIHSDKDISVPQTPWTSYGTMLIGFFFVRGIDRDGLGIGKEFYLPLETSMSTGGRTYPCRLHVFAFYENTQVKVTRIPKGGGNETFIWEGTLNKGEYYTYTT